MKCSPTKSSVPKNPNRVAAGRRNRAKRGELTEAGRVKLRQAAMLNQPWNQSTGPVTAEGKAAVASNLPERPRRSEAAGEIKRIFELLGSLAVFTASSEAMSS